MPRFAMPTKKSHRSSGGSSGGASLVRLNNASSSKTTTKDDFILDNSFDTDISTDISNTSELHEARLPRSSSSLSSASGIETDGSMTGDSLDKIIGQSTTKVATTNKLRGILRGGSSSSNKNKKDITPVPLPVSSSIVDPPQIQYQHQQYQQPWIHPVPPPNNPTNIMSCYDYSCMPMQQQPLGPPPMPLPGSVKGMLPGMPPPGMMPYMMPNQYYYMQGGGMCGGSVPDGGSVKSGSRGARGGNAFGAAAAPSSSSGYYCAPVASVLPSQYYNCYDYSCGHPDIAAVSVGSTSEGDYSAITSCGGSCAITMCAEPCEGLAEFVRRSVESFAMRGENDLTDYGSLGKGCFSTCGTGSGGGGEIPPTTAEEEVGGGNGTPEKYKKKQQEETEQSTVVGEESVTINSTADQSKVSTTSTLGMLSALFGMGGASDTKLQDQPKEEDDDDDDDNVPEEEEAKLSSTAEGDVADPAKDIKSKIKENLLKDHFLELKKSVDEDDTTDIKNTKKLSRRRSKERSINLPPKVAFTGILKNSTKKDSPTTTTTAAVDAMGFPLSTTSKSWESDFFSGSSNPFIASSTPSCDDIRSIASPTTVIAATLDTPLRNCAWCGVGGTNTKAAQKLKLCSACQSTYYCSADCQSKDWTNGHSVTCGKKSS